MTKQGIQHINPYKNIFQSRLANTKTHVPVPTTMVPKGTAIEEQQHAASTVTKIANHCFFKKIFPYNFKKKYKNDGNIIFGKRAFPCQILNSKKDDCVYTDVLPNTFITFTNKKNTHLFSFSFKRHLPTSHHKIYEMEINTAGIIV